MIKTSKQLKDLVGNRAHGDSAKSMLFLRNYAMERFLERLSASKYRNCFILKGGMLISAMVGIDSRATMDIDTTLRNYPLNCESAEQIVRQIADVEIDDKISFVIKKTEEIMEDSAAGNYDIDIHSPDGSGTSHYYFPAGKWYTIPYRSLLPKGAANLLVAGRCISVDHEAQASIRIMPIVCCLGEAAGTAASVAKNDNVRFKDADIAKIQHLLTANGAIIHADC